MPGQAPIPKPSSAAWPPAPLPDAPADRRAVDFTAPPRLPAPAPARHTLDLPAPALSPWQQIERAWLGLTTPPLAQRALLHGWRADAPGEACPRCASTVGAFESDDEGCPACRNRRLPWSRCIRLAEYQGLLRRCICEVKFTAWRRLGRDLGRLLGARIIESLEHAGLSPAQAALVPVPSTFLRRLRRGIDHTHCIARGVRDVTGIPILPVLSRRHRPPQSALPLSRRATNVRDTMRARARDLSGLTVIVLDDVRTTGATMTEACRALRRIDAPNRPAHIWSAVLAVTPDERRRNDLHWRSQPDQPQPDQPAPQAPEPEA
ncbi:MAG: hypothetical protein GC200_07670 [Tepidisphaera sp.]|nr:hypothetical protein [Tepidisphaera sp.]